MTKAIYLCSLHEHVGKSLLAIGIMLNLQEQGKKVAYFKPVGIPKGAFSDKADRDVGFIQNTVFKTDLPYDIISPVSIPDCYYVDLIDSSKKEDHLISIKQAYEELSKKYDYIIIEGAPSIKKYIRVGLDDVTVAKTLGINELVYIQTESSDNCIDNLFFTKKYFEFRDVKFKGVIFNKIDHEYKARIEELRENHIERYDISIIALIPKILELLSPRVAELQWAIGGELLNELAIEGLEITGGDRSDVALAALNENASVLILTGFIKPDAAVINEANKKKIPIILSPSDTYTTIRNMERVKPSIQEQEINLVKELVKTHFNWDVLLE
ncbi:MAG: AAA family ATPase [Promethearchaeota archaeon]